MAHEVVEVSLLFNGSSFKSVDGGSRSRRRYAYLSFAHFQKKSDLTYSAGRGGGYAPRDTGPPETVIGYSSSHSA